MRKIKRWFYLKMFDWYFKKMRESDPTMDKESYDEMTVEARQEFIREFNL